MNITLKSLMDYLNEQHSMISIIHVDMQSGIITLSNQKQFNVRDLKVPADVEPFLQDN